MGGGGGGSTTTSGLDPTLQPYVSYGLEEAKRQYQAPGAQFFPGQTYVSPSAATQTALQAAQQRAVMGSPIQQAAQQEYLSTVQGRGVNPFLEGALSGANRRAEEAYTRGVQGLQSQASSMGRYGSNAMGQQVGQAQDVFGRNLAEQAGQLAYQSAEAERGRQMQAVANAPAYAQADYQDIQKLLTAGQGQESYQQKALQDAINRYNYEQTMPERKLQQFTNLFTSAPAGGTSTTTQSGGK
ncbi:hypothetical protein UFOVP684_48 [uncultured Caudovirales phage]|uniref:Uncharacterized protein n=1 Tax=uncultured Caudovirales phage TaxID=2100421 RepID=A0A6J5M1D2_9CAUD|nr:hypothetical protein UFOVP409_54 [uncultured Caudovirales phage]CAB4157838.1 hypothetical protein UFOVP684_48 [uncultured Caudovirales phage]